MKLSNQSHILEDDTDEELTYRQPSSLRKNLYTVAAMFLVVAVIFIWGWFKGRSSALDNRLVVEPITPVITLEVIESEIKAIGELATMEYMYTNAAKFSDSHQFFRWNIPWTEKAFVMKWDGIIKAGIDIEEIDIDIKERNKLIIIRLPKAEILSHDPDRNSVQVLDEKNGLFNQVKVEDQIKFEAACEEEMNQRAIDNGLLEKAEENAKNIILKILNALPGIEDVYTIEFVVG